MKKGDIYFRADGNAKIGLGHVIRSVALADMLKNDFKCHFIIRAPLPMLKQQILEICQSVIELPDTKANTKEAKEIADNFLTGQEFVVLDGYHFKTAYQQVIKDKGCKLVCIDDIHNYHFVADVVINHAGGITNKIYSAEPYTQFCLGLDYALLRKPFRKAAKNRSDANRGNCVFICLGGSDPNNDTLKVLKLCEELQDIDKCNLVIGEAYEHKNVLGEYLKQSKLDIELLSNLSAYDMALYMKKCQKAITSPSTVSYEYLSVGGELYLQITAENQNAVYQFLTKSGLAFPFKEFPVRDIHRSTLLRSRQAKIFDGLQAKRFVSLFRAIGLNIRKAKKTDCQFYYELVNDPLTRAYSYKSRPILFEEHKNWFDAKVSNSDAFLYVGEYQGEPAGQIRFEISDKQIVISFALDSKYRGRGLGKILLKKGMEQFKVDSSNHSPIVGYVKKENVTSIKSFQKLGFIQEETADFPNSYKFIMLQ